MHDVTETDPADPFDLNLKNCFSLDFFFFFNRWVNSLL